MFNEYEIGEEVLADYPGWMPGPDEDQLWKGVIIVIIADARILSVPKFYSKTLSGLPGDYPVFHGQYPK